MCGMCGKIHQGTLVSSKKSLADYEVLDIHCSRDAHTREDQYLVQEVDVWKKAEDCGGIILWVPASSVELFESFYSRMH